METQHVDLECQLARVKELSDCQLAEQLGQLVRRKCTLDADLLLYLSELDCRGLYREHAVSSLFEYCVSRLGFSEDVAYKRVGVARLLRQFPLVYELISTGRIHLSALMLMKPHLTQDNHREWLSAALGKSKRQVELLVATRCPRPDIAPSVRKLPGTKPGHAKANQCVETQDSRIGCHSAEPVADLAARMPNRTQTTAPDRTDHPALPTAPDRTDHPALATAPDRTDHPALPTAPDRTDHPALATAPGRPTPTADIAPLSGSTYRITFTASDCLKQKLDRARELTSHAVAPSDLPRLFERALDLLIAREERRRFAVGATRKRNTSHSATTRQEPCQMSNSESPLAQDPGRVAPSSAQSVSAQSVSAQSVSAQSVSAQSVSAQSVSAQSVSAQSVSAQSVSAQSVSAQSGSAQSGSRYVPAAVRREVWQRDNGRCTYTDAQGNRCNERHYLEIEHRLPFALGGAASVENCALLCSSHNALAARVAFGRSKVESAIERERRRFE